MTFWQVGGFFAGFGILSSFIVREPLRGIYTFKTKTVLPALATNEFPLWTLFKQFYAILQVSCIRWNLLGTFFRFWTNSTIGSFSLLYTNMYGKP
jgi:hypothetical protein